MVHYKKKEKKFDKNTLSNSLFKHKLKSYIKMNKLHYHPIQFISSVHVFAIYSKTWLQVHVSSRDQWIYFFILWNYFNSFRSTFIGNKNFPGLWEQNFVGSVIRINLIKYQTSACINVCGYVNFVGKGCSRKPQTLFP